MRYKLFLFLLVFVSCKKPNDDTRRVTADLTIADASSPKTVTQGNGIITLVRSVLPNSCYEFSNLEIKKINAIQFEIRAKGTMPTGNGDLTCIEIFRVKDTTAIINTAVTGQYLLHFYNGNSLFKTDTVIVN